MPALMGRKIGMTRWFKEDGTNVPVTVVEAGPCTVTQIKRSEQDGYSAVQLGWDDIKPRRSTMQLIGHDAKAGTTPKRCHTELRLPDDKAVDDFEIGQTGRTPVWPSGSGRCPIDISFRGADFSPVR